ncbi:hypothetical protein [Vibrio hippocampi]|uniref:Uncharacterized protein n=1 Tax=Vibrio hippocampi TaxID=654686 RepID=A0ABM8ZMC2_9VIBR|nr:hypothetical protein [Vibrio hippocampi]CAH0529193.1 hypothetical protein VHP8226_03097 [Vibrio hippocampi]
MKKSILSAVLVSVALAGFSVAGTAEAAPYVKKHKRVIGKPVPHRPVYRAPVRKVYIGKPYHRAGWSYWAHPIASAVAFAIVVDAVTGDLQDEQGNDVVVLGDGGEVTATYEKDGTVYIITQ